MPDRRVEVRRQPTPNLLLLLEMLVAIPLIWVLLAGMKLPTLLHILDQPAGPRRKFDQAAVELAEVAWRYTYFILIKFGRLKKPCQLRSLAVFTLLRRRGLDIRIHFGVRKDDLPLTGHCWVSLSGEQVVEQQDPREIYIETYSYPPSETDYGDRH